MKVPMSSKALFLKTSRAVYHVTCPIQSTGNDINSGDRYCGNDRYSGLEPPDDAILFTVSGITAIADKKSEILIKKCLNQP